MRSSARRARAVLAPSTSAAFTLGGLWKAHNSSASHGLLAPSRTPPAYCHPRNLFSRSPPRHGSPSTRSHPRALRLFSFPCGGFPHPRQNWHMSRDRPHSRNAACRPSQVGPGFMRPELFLRLSTIVTSQRRLPLARRIEVRLPTGCYGGVANPSPSNPVATICPHRSVPRFHLPVPAKPSFAMALRKTTTSRMVHPAGQAGGETCVFATLPAHRIGVDSVTQDYFAHRSRSPCLFTPATNFSKDQPRLPSKHISSLRKSRTAYRTALCDSAPEGFRVFLATRPVAQRFRVHCNDAPVTSTDGLACPPYPSIAPRCGKSLVLAGSDVRQGPSVFPHCEEATCGFVSTVTASRNNAHSAGETPSRHHFTSQLKMLTPRNTSPPPDVQPLRFPRRARARGPYDFCSERSPPPYEGTNGSTERHFFLACLLGWPPHASANVNPIFGRTLGPPCCARKAFLPAELQRGKRPTRCPSSSTLRRRTRRVRPPSSLPRCATSRPLFTGTPSRLPPD